MKIFTFKNTIEKFNRDDTFVVLSQYLPLMCILFSTVTLRLCALSINYYSIIANAFSFLCFFISMISFKILEISILYKNNFTAIEDCFIK